MAQLVGISSVSGVPSEQKFVTCPSRPRLHHQMPPTRHPQTVLRVKHPIRRHHLFGGIQGDPSATSADLQASRNQGLERQSAVCGQAPTTAPGLGAPQRGGIAFHGMFPVQVKPVADLAFTPTPSPLIKTVCTLAQNTTVKWDRWVNLGGPFT